VRDRLEIFSSELEKNETMTGLLKKKLSVCGNELKLEASDVK